MPLLDRAPAVINMQCYNAIAKLPDYVRTLLYLNILDPIIRILLFADRSYCPPKMAGKLDGKVILITGAASGIG